MVNIPCLKVRENISRFAFIDVFAVQVKVCVGGGEVTRVTYYRLNVKLSGHHWYVK